MTEAVRCRAFTGFPALVIANTGEFDTWVASVSPLTRAPSSPYTTAVEAASFVIYGAFLAADDILALAEVQIKIAGSVEVVGEPSNRRGSWPSGGCSVLTRMPRSRYSEERRHASPPILLAISFRSRASSSPVG
jgi:hypothetical protein